MSLIKWVRILAIGLAGVVAGGCNNGIFISDLPALEPSVTVAGNGGNHTVYVDRNQLTGVRLDCEFDYDTHTEYFDADGNELAYEAPMSEVSIIRYSSPRFLIEVFLKGNRLTFVAVDNTYSCDLDVILILDYGSFCQSVTVTVLPGKPMQLKNIIYFSGNVTTATKVKSFTERFTNAGGRPQRITYYPMRDAESKVSYMSDDMWSVGIEGVCQVPVFDGDHWEFDNGNSQEITLGMEETFSPVSVNRDEAVEVDVPANSTVTVTISVTYAVCWVEYMAELSLPESGIGLLTNGTCSVAQPIGYKLVTMR